MVVGAINRGWLKLLALLDNYLERVAHRSGRAYVFAQRTPSFAGNTFFFSKHDHYVID
jgi:hypothetical protein